MSRYDLFDALRAVVEDWESSAAADEVWAAPWALGAIERIEGCAVMMGYVGVEHVGGLAVDVDVRVWARGELRAEPMPKVEAVASVAAAAPVAVKAYAPGAKPAWATETRAVRDARRAEARVRHAEWEAERAVKQAAEDAQIAAYKAQQATKRGVKP